MILTREKTASIREQNDTFRKSAPMLYPSSCHVRVRGKVAEKGKDFIKRALEVVAAYDYFPSRLDPRGEHDFGRCRLDGVDFSWKINYNNENGLDRSSDPSDPTKTTREIWLITP